MAWRSADTKKFLYVVHAPGLPGVERIAINDDGTQRKA